MRGPEGSEWCSWIRVEKLRAALAAAEASEEASMSLAMKCQLGREAQPRRGYMQEAPVPLGGLMVAGRDGRGGGLHV